MATYNKRGYKEPKSKELKEEEQVIRDGQNSQTAEVFNSLDSTANKIGTWFTLNQKPIFIGIGVLVAIALGSLLYWNFVMQPKEDEAANEMFQAQQYYNDAQNTASDSLYNLALNGGEGKLGFLKIIENYSGTDAANNANFYVGTIYLNTGKYAEAIKHLEKFDSKDLVLKASALGAIGDAFSELGQKEEALEYYKKAAKHNPNDYTTPRFAFKAGIVALDLGKKEEASRLFEEIKNDYTSSPQAQDIDFYIGLAK